MLDRCLRRCSMIHILRLTARSSFDTPTTTLGEFRHATLLEISSRARRRRETLYHEPQDSPVARCLYSIFVPQMHPLLLILPLSLDYHTSMHPSPQLSSVCSLRYIPAASPGHNSPCLSQIDLRLLVRSRTLCSHARSSKMYLPTAI